ncbi:MAG: hypothetical protein IJC43_05550 [Clostridia bacterium]|nr:hypothetical protein [Clostridia bacterium]
MTAIREWAFTIACAGLICGVVRGLIPQKTMEKQLGLLLSLSLLTIFFSRFPGLLPAEQPAASLPEGEAAAVLGQHAAEEGVLLVTRLELARMVEEILQEETGRPHKVAGISLHGRDGELKVAEIVFCDLTPDTPQQVGEILQRRLSIETEISEVKQSP